MSVSPAAQILVATPYPPPFIQCAPIPFESTLFQRRTYAHFRSRKEGATNRIFTRLVGVGIVVTLCMVGGVTWVQAQDDAQGAVTDSTLASDPVASWLHGNGNWAGHRHSLLTQLNPSNVGDFRIAWFFSAVGETDAQRTPLYHDGWCIRRRTTQFLPSTLGPAAGCGNTCTSCPMTGADRWPSSSPASISTWPSTGSTGWSAAI